MTEIQAAELIQIGHNVAIAVGAIAFWVSLHTIFGLFRS